MPICCTRGRRASKRNCARCRRSARSTAILHLSSPRVNVDIDRDRALSLGVTPEQIANTLYDAYGNRRVSHIAAAANQYDVILEVPPENQREPAALSKLYIRSSNNKPIPLSAVTRLKPGVSPLSINHIGQLPAVNFEFNAKKGISLSDATAQVQEAARDIGLPDSMSFTFQGTAAGIREFASRPGHSACDRRAGDLPCSRRALREFHSPDHDSVRPACRGNGSAASRCCCSTRT